MALENVKNIKDYFEQLYRKIWKSEEINHF